MNNLSFGTVSLPTGDGAVVLSLAQAQRRRKMLRSIKKRIKNASRSSSASSAETSAEESSMSASNSPQQQQQQQQHGSGYFSKVRRSSPAEKKKQTARSSKINSPLASFDACVYAADALAADDSLHTAAASSPNKPNNILSARRDAASGLVDCSVLVSADGNLLLVPSVCKYRKSDNHKKTDQASVDRTTSLLQQDTDDEEDNDQTEDDKKTADSSSDDDEQQELFSQLIAHGKDDYDSAIFFGNDLAGGDLALNGFSAKGWSIPATSHALYQTEAAVSQYTAYAKDCWQARQEECRTILQSGVLPQTESSSPSSWRKPLRNNKRNTSWELIDPRASDFEPRTDRVGPLRAPQSTLHQAVQAMQNYQNTSAQRDLERFRDDELDTSLVQLSERVERRQQALEETSRSVRVMEEMLVQRKQTADKCWEAVYQAEAKAVRKVEQILKEKSREREKQRLADMRQQEKQTDTGLGTTSEEIWDIVTAVADSMDDASFEPMMDLPSGPLKAPRDKSRETDGVAAENGQDHKREPSGKEDFLDKSEPVSREAIEHTVGLPELRLAAMRADENIEDAAQELLVILSQLDTTRRSARLSAEACLVAAGNAQARSLKTWIQVERESLEERLASLRAVDDAVDQINVRADLNDYITDDKKVRGGSSHLGDDDDGGVASALAALSSHVDGIMGHGNTVRKQSVSDAVIRENDDNATPLATPDGTLEVLFNDTFDEQDEATKSTFEEAVASLCRIALDDSPLGAARRSALCYGLNAKRSSHVEIQTPTQFDGLCKVFEAILTGCASEEGGVSNAKMCIMLAQTFYLENAAVADSLEANSGTSSSPSRMARSKRIYIRSRLMDHPIWSKDDFWYVECSPF